MTDTPTTPTPLSERIKQYRRSIHPDSDSYKLLGEALPDVEAMEAMK